MRSPAARESRYCPAVPPRCAVIARALVLLGMLALGGCETPPAQPAADRTEVARDPLPAAPPPAQEAPQLTLCQRLDVERAALDLGEPLQARVASFDQRARRFLERTDVSPATRGALSTLLEDPTSSAALAALNADPASFASDPTLPDDAILAALVASDAAPPASTNAGVVALVAQARAWRPTEPAIPWLEALVIPERGGRRALLQEAFDKGARDPALLLALARAALRDGDPTAALAVLDAIPQVASGTASSPPLGGALRERAEAIQRARLGLQRTERAGIEVWAPASLAEGIALQLAGAVRTHLDDAATLLDGPARPRLTVWVHASLDDFNATTCGTSWSRAFYDGVLHVVLAGDTLDPALQQSARHESLHAQLDSLSPLAPRWLHEGLAQRFAGEPLDPATPLASFSSAQVRAIDRDLGLGNDGTTAGAAYARSRLAVEQLVSRSGGRAFADAVRALRSGTPASALPELLGFVD